MRCLGISVLLAFFAGGLASAPARAQSASDVSSSIGRSIVEALSTRGLPETSLGATVVRVSDGKVIWQQRAEVPMQPASTMKVVTSIVALDTLGPAFRARAELVTAAPIVDGVLQGDLVLRGYGNPDLEWEDFRNMLLTLREATGGKAIQRIAGNLIVDRQFFSPSRLDLGVPPFDETPEFRYNVIPDATLINMNLLRFDIESDGSGFRVRTTPKLEGVKLIANMNLADRACDKWEEGWRIPTTVKAVSGEIRVYLEGSFPRNCAASPAINVIDRADYAARLFQSLWRGLGGEFSGAVLEASSPIPIEGFRVLAEHRSRALAEFTRNINKVSDNTITRTAYLLLGAGERADPQQTSLAKAEATVRAWMRSRAIDDDGMVIDNGSGLSRTERLTARQLAEILRAAARSKWAPEFVSSLPIAATDGSMRARLRDTPAAETARIKTGSLRNVVSVAGYVTDRRGETYAVAAMINDDRAIRAGGRQVLDTLLERVASMGQ
ncbi:MAG: D-alanyl-D-alanine carboxypeptidase/D-alanyl-D-alanine-endopeptidase [Burkholderiales bacterium]|nr:D-alanyl-D-alanine carboxypeptidase/D-alanyl-D-alanine-endopeptidase [Nitrosomonadaceae bacterium]